MSDNVVRYTGNARAWRSATGVRVTQDDPYATGLSPAEAEWLVDEHDFEHADADDARDDDPGAAVARACSGTVDELADALETGEFDGRLGAVEAYERDNQNRKGALEAVQERRESVQESDASVALREEDDEEDILEQ